MKLSKSACFCFVLVLLFSSKVIANDYPAAVTALANELIKPTVSSHQLDVGLGVDSTGNDAGPAIVVKSRLFFQRKYNMGAMMSFQPSAIDSQGLDVYGGLSVGMKGFNSTIGGFTINTLVGYGVTSDVERFIIEPGVSLPLFESRAINYFWIRHKLGLTATLGYRHAIDKNNIVAFDDFNAVKLTLDIFINQKRIN